MLRRVTTTVLLTLLVTSISLAGPKIKSVKEYKSYEKIVLTADGVSDKAQILWDVTGDCDVEEVGNKLYVWAKPGSYNVVMTAVDFDAKKIDRARTSFTVLSDTPPSPPVPPPPPTPTDPLAQAFQKAYDADMDSDRVTSLAFLQGAYKAMASQAGSRPEKTNAAFVTWMKTVVEAPTVGLKQAQLKNLRTSIGQELASSWGTTAVPLAASDAAKELQKISDALGKVK